jgi:hypothetical protein
VCCGPERQYAINWAPRSGRGAMSQKRHKLSRKVSIMKYCKKNYKIKNTKKWKTLKVGEITVYIDKPISRDYSKFS